MAVQASTPTFRTTIRSLEEDGSVEEIEMSSIETRTARETAVLISKSSPSLFILLSANSLHLGSNLTR